MKNFILIVCILAFGLSYGQQNSTNKLTDLLRDEVSKIEKHADDKLKINIIMKDNIDYNNACKYKHNIVDRAEQRVFAAAELKKTAQKCQADLNSLLKRLEAEGEVCTIKSLWIVNAINCMATPKAIDIISKHNDVEMIEYDAANCFIPKPIESKSIDINSTMESTIADNIVQMNVPAVWGMGYEGEGVVVAIIDTGINYEHADFQGNLWDGGDKYPYHGWNFDDDNNDPMDVQGHGTHCAGTVLGNGASGVKTGVAPKAKIMALKALAGYGSGSNSSNAWFALEFAIENGADIVTGSFAVAPSLQPNNKAWRQAFDNLLNAGIIATIAAGNEYGNASIPENVTIPGKIPSPWIHPDQMENTGGISSVLTVGAVDSNNNRAGFSSVGPVTWQDVEGYNDYAFRPQIGLIKPDVAAPGVDVKSLDYKNLNGYRLESGTSMATPGVAGIVALMLSKNKELTPMEIAEILQSTTTKLTDTKSNRFGTGLVDAYKAVLRVKGGVFPSVVTTNHNNMIAVGTTTALDFKVKNSSGSNVENLTVTVSSDSPQVIFEGSSSATITSINKDGEVDLTGIFSFSINDNTSNSNYIDFLMTITDENSNKWLTSFSLPLASPALELVSVKIDDHTSSMSDKSIVGNGIFEFGEKANILITVRNIGNEKATVRGGEYFVTGKWVKVTSYNFVGDIEPGSTATFTMSIENNGSEANIGNKIEFCIYPECQNGTTSQIDFEIIEGKLKALIVDKSDNELSKSLAKELQSNCYDVAVMKNSVGISNLGNYSSLWFIMGENSKNGYIDEDDDWLIRRFLNNGGKVYLEGINTWAKDNAAILGKFDIRKSASLGSLTGVSGMEGISTEGLALGYTSSNNQVYRISGLNSAFPILQNSAPVFNLSIANVTDNYITIGSNMSFENITANDDTNQTKAMLLSRLLEQLQLPSSYYEPVSNLKAIVENEAVNISWNAPYIPKSNSEAYNKISGYFVYRDGVQINKEPIAESTYKDNEIGKTYGVRAYYTIGTSDLITTIATNSIDENIADYLKIYPNPATNYIYIDGDFQEVELVNTLGQTIYKTNHTQQIDIKDVNNGVYILKIKIDNNKVVTNKITINK